MDPSVTAGPQLADPLRLALLLALFSMADGERKRRQGEDRPRDGGYTWHDRQVSLAELRHHPAIDPRSRWALDRLNADAGTRSG